MCDPTLGLMTLSFISSYGQAQGQKEGLKFNAAVNEQNAALARQRGQDAIATANFNAARRETQGKREADAIKTKQSASGVAVGVGSALDVLMGHDLVATADAGLIRGAGDREAWGSEIEALGLETSAKFQRKQASAINPLLQGATSAITTGMMVNPGYFAAKTATTTTGAVAKGAGAAGVPQSRFKLIPYPG